MRPDSELSDERDAVIALVKPMAPVVDDPSDAEREFHLEHATYMGPFAAAIITANFCDSKQKGQADVDRYGKIIDEQLQRGGVRLATILNRCLQ